MQTDLYQALGVPRTATASEIKKAYRTLAKRHHPDRNPEDAEAEERFKTVSAAFAVLGDDEKRRRYDEFGIDGLREGFDPEVARGQRFGRGFDPRGMGQAFGGFGDLDELLGGLFGGGLGRGSRRPRRGANLEGSVGVSLRDALEGTEVSLPGQGLRVQIPKGVADGQRIRLGGQGEPGPGGSGDLYLKVSVTPPAGFERDGDDLLVELPLTVLQAMRGGPVELPTPEGTIATLKIPAGIQSGQRLRLRGKGMPIKGGGRGALFARIQVRIPRAEPKALELAEQLEAFYDQDQDQDQD